MNNNVIQIIKNGVKPFYKFYAYYVKWRGKVIIPMSSYVSPGSTFEGMSQVHYNVSFYGHLGYGSYIGPNCRLNADIGRFTSIASNVHVISGRHPYTYPFATTSPAFFSLNRQHFQNGSTFAKKQMFEETSYYDNQRGVAVKIGSDCWIGEGTAIISGVKIGDGAVVLAHAVVTQDVPPYSIVGGVPARILKFRYDENTIDFLLRTKWWNQSSEWLSENWELLCDIEKLKENFDRK